MASPLAFPKASHAATVSGSRRIRVVGIGGSRRPGSSTEQVIAAVLAGLDRQGATTKLYGGASLLFPHYEPGAPLTPAAADYLAAVRAADAIVLGSPGYHGGISGLVKNAVDYLTPAYGWQAAVSTLSALRQTVHALRGWPTPYGIAMNVADGLGSFEGPFTDTRAGESARLVSGQIMQFVTAFRDAPAPR